MVFRWPIFTLSVLTLQAINVVLWEFNSVCNIHSRVQPCPADGFELLLNNFSHLNGVALSACGNLDGHIDGLLHMLGTMYRWYASAFSNDLWNIPTPVACQDRSIVQSAVAARTASKEEIRGSAHVCLWPGYHLHHETADVVKELTGEWNGALI